MIIMSAFFIVGGYFTGDEDYRLVKEGGTVQRTNPIVFNKRYERRLI